MDRMPQTFGHVQVFVREDQPRMSLPRELVPGVVPWPPGFREEIDAWLLGFFGTTNLLKDGEVVYVGHEAIHVNPRTYAQLRAAVKGFA